MREVIRLESMSSAQKTILRDKYDIFFFDFDGTLVQLNTEPYPGAQDVVTSLAGLGKTLYIYTDSDLNSKERYARKVGEHFPEIREENIITASLLIVEHLMKIGFMKKIFAIGSEEGILTDLRNAGFEVIFDRNSGTYYKIDDLFIQELEEGVGAVVCGADFNFSYVKLMKAIQYLSDPSVLFLVSHLLLYAHVNPTVPAAGSLALMMSTITNRQPTTCSKGSAKSHEYIQSLGYDMKRCLFIGDGITSDIRFGNECGMDTLLVLCGHTKEHNLLEYIEKGEQEFIPTHHRAVWSRGSAWSPRCISSHSTFR